MDFAPLEHHVEKIQRHSGKTEKVYVPDNPNEFWNVYTGRYEAGSAYVNPRGDTLQVYRQQFSDTIQVTDDIKFASHPIVGPSAFIMETADAIDSLLAYGDLGDTLSSPATFAILPSAPSSAFGSGALHVPGHFNWLGQGSSLQGGSVYDLRVPLSTNGGIRVVGTAGQNAECLFPIAMTTLDNAAMTCDIRFELNRLTTPNDVDMSITFMKYDAQMNKIGGAAASATIVPSGNSITFSAPSAFLYDNTIAFLRFKLVGLVLEPNMAPFTLEAADLTLLSVGTGAQFTVSARVTAFGPSHFEVSKAVQGLSESPGTPRVCLLGQCMWIKVVPTANVSSRVYGYARRGSVVERAFLKPAEIMSLGGKAFNGRDGIITTPHPLNQSTYATVQKYGAYVPDWDSSYIDVDVSFSETTTSVMVVRIWQLVYGVITNTREIKPVYRELQSREALEFFGVLSQMPKVFENKKHKVTVLKALEHIYKHSPTYAGAAKAIWNAVKTVGPMALTAAALVV